MEIATPPLLHFLPVRYRSPNLAEQGVLFGRADSLPASIYIGAASFELSKQMLPLVVELTGCNRQQSGLPDRADFSCIKRIASGCCLGMNVGQKAIHRRYGRCVGAKSCQLWMMLIPAGLAPKYRPRQERFTPERDQPLSVQVLGME
jgi:hypothetical protein